MWLIRHKAGLVDSGFFNGFTDFHSHILPGVDDGVKTRAEALETLDYFSGLKVSKVIFTPHMMNGMANRVAIELEFEAFCKEYRGDIQLELGAEYMLDSGFEERRENGLLRLEPDRVLVETSYFSSPPNFYELLYNISIAGITPVIAHPERYLYMDDSNFYKLKEKDYLLQLNLLSLAGYYGKRVMRNAEFLLDKGLYDRIGTDLHDLQVFKEWIGGLKVTDNQLEKLAAIC